MSRNESLVLFGSWLLVGVYPPQKLVSEGGPFDKLGYKYLETLIWLLRTGEYTSPPRRRPKEAPSKMKR